MRWIAGLALVVGLAAAAPSRAAEPFPDRPIHIVVPYVPGVGADIAARVLADRLGDIFKVAVVVDNKPGASGAIGTAAVIHSPPDGTNVLITGGDEPTDDVVNTWHSPGRAPSPYRWPRIAGGFHGAGCTLASAIAALLARGLEMPAALQQAQQYTHGSLRRARAIGQGRKIPGRLPA